LLQAQQTTRLALAHKKILPSAPLPAVITMHLSERKSKTGAYSLMEEASAVRIRFRFVILVAVLDSFLLVPNSRAQDENLPSAPDPQQSSSQQQQPQQQQQQPNAPNLGDLGFPNQQTQANPKLQALLDRRTHMLKVHQKLGLITLAPMAATLITGPMAKAKGRNGETIKEPTDANLDFHMALGGLTTAMYWTTASYAIFAPNVAGTHHKGPIRVHEALAWIHGPGMVATPVLGYMAYKQENSGEKTHGIASAHGPVAWATVGAYAAAMIAVSWPLKLHRH